MFAGIGGIFVTSSSGYVFMPTYFLYLGDICPPAIIGYAWMAYAFTSFILNVAVPLVFKSNESMVYGIPVLLLVIFLNFVFVAFYYIETYGLEKSLIYKKLRGEKVVNNGRKIVPKLKNQQ